MLLCAVLGVLAEINYVFLHRNSAVDFSSFRSLPPFLFISADRHHRGPLPITLYNQLCFVMCEGFCESAREQNARGTGGGPNENDRKNCHYHSHCLKQCGSISRLERTSCQPGVGGWCHQWYFYVDPKMAANQGCSTGGRSLCRPFKFFHAKHVHAFIFFCWLACVGTRRGL